MNLEQIDALKQKIPYMGKQEQLETLELVDEWVKREEAKASRSSLLTFVKHMDPTYKIGPHHRRLAAILEAMAEGRKDRATVSMAPRMGK